MLPTRFCLAVAALFLGACAPDEEGAAGEGFAPGEKDASRALLLLESFDGPRVVRFTRWDDERSAARYAEAARAATPTPRYATELEWRSLGRKPEQSLTFGDSSAVQFSQFVMYRTSAVDTLQGLAAGMSGGMVAGELTMRLISTLTARDSSAVVFLGTWDSPVGFKIFEQRGTFGAEPYWEPFAANEHHMMRVLEAWTAVKAPR